MLPPSLLVASPQMRVREHRQTVALLLEIGRKGAIGLVVNRPSPLPLQSFVRSEVSTIPSQIKVWDGGSANLIDGVILHNRPTQTKYDNPGDVFELSKKHIDLQRLIDARKDEGRTDCLAIKYPYRFIVGCLSWYPRQLDEELKQGEWMPLSLDQHILFNVPAEEMWQYSLAVLGINPEKIIPQTQLYAH